MSLPGTVATPKKRSHPEIKLQASIVEYIRTVAIDAICYSIPNSTVCSKSEAAKQKYMGLLAGVPDLALVIPGGRHAFIEVKTDQGSLSLEQKAFREFLISSGHPYVVARSINDVKAALTQWRVKTRESA